MAARSPTRSRPAAPTRDALAGEVWGLIAGFFFRHGARHMGEAVRVSGLNPGAIKLLQWLDPGQPKPMRAIADALSCDASNVTWLVDRLEERELVERRPEPGDRRVKTIVLTDAGIEMQARLAEAWSEPPASLATLGADDLLALVEALRKLPSA